MTRISPASRTAMLVAAALLGLLALGACNTVKGVGQDVGAAGNAIERAGRN